MSDTSNKTPMEQIKANWGQLISQVCAKSSVPECFLAALIANETGGNTNATRFEAGIFQNLLNVREDRTLCYGGIRKDKVIDQTDDGLRLLATSRGLTQIMGYVALRSKVDPLDLVLPEICLCLTLQLLADFAKIYSLDATKDFEKMFRCWDTDEPDRKTFDPDYVRNGLARIAIWKEMQ